MIAIGWIIVSIYFIRVAGSFYNFISCNYLPQKNSDINESTVSILIPARNEEENIGRILQDLCEEPCPIGEIIVYNDNSTDRTAQIVNDYVQRMPYLSVIEGDELPEGWMGKNYACYQLAQRAKGEILIFLDADVHIKNHFIDKAVHYLQKNKLCLLSFFPVQEMPDTGSKLVVPLMNRILLSLLPLPLIRLTDIPSLAAANGQCLIFDAFTYSMLQPHRLYKEDAVEDMAIVKDYKKRKLKVATLLGDNDICCRMYHNYREAIQGFSKNFFSFFGGKASLSFLFALITTLGPLFIWIYGPLSQKIAVTFFILIMYLFTSLASRQNVLSNILLSPLQTFSMWVIIINGLIGRKNKNILWKNRNIYS